MKVNTRVTTDLSGVKRKTDSIAKLLQVTLDEQVLKDSNYYIPRDTGNLEDSSRTSSLIGKGTLIWSAPYAATLYWNPQYNFSKDSNPNARGKWFEEAKAANLNSWLGLLQRM